MAAIRQQPPGRRQVLRSLLLLSAIAGAAVLSSQAALNHCRRALSAPGIDDSSGGSSSDGGAAALVATATLQQPAGLQQQQQQQQQVDQQLKSTQQNQGRHLRPLELDAPANSGTLGLQAARAAAAADAPVPVPQPGVIPKILHRVYIADPNDPKRHNYTMPVAHQRWIESCQLHQSPRSGWRYMYWDYAAAQALIANHFPWFLPFYEANITKAIEKSDVVRYAVLHRLGGFYLDSDIECWREAYDMLEGFDFVAQGTHAAEGATNAAIAARPGLDVFVKALQLVQTREIDTSKQVIKVIARTGPQLLTDALVATGLQLQQGMFSELYERDGVVYRLWPVGTWYQPCQWWDTDCRKRIYRERAEGRYDMQRLAGFHRMVGSWIPGKQDGIGILNVTHELCGGATHVRGNGQIGGWVAPQRTSIVGRRTLLEYPTELDPERAQLDRQGEAARPLGDRDQKYSQP